MLVEYLQLLEVNFRATEWGVQPVPWSSACLVFGETAARLVQVCMIPQNVKGALRSCA